MLAAIPDQHVLGCTIHLCVIDRYYLLPIYIVQSRHGRGNSLDVALLLHDDRVCCRQPLCKACHVSQGQLQLPGKARGYLDCVRLIPRVDLVQGLHAMGWA